MTSTSLQVSALVAHMTTPHAFLQLYNVLLRFQPVCLLFFDTYPSSDPSLEICAPEKVSLVIAREAGDYSIATTMEPPGASHVHM